MTRIRFAAALAASAFVFATSAAVADTHWAVYGVFDDGTTLNGYFDLNNYGYLGAYKLTTQAGPVLAAGVYQTGDSTAASASTKPEPAAWALMLVGLAGLGATLRRRRVAAT